ncbi:hypothetical protein OBBRIDRAFT_889448 [Obba rivulosa]|uniref:F-box domain-containing protein n=1 Tax=Obba rivulosa TaxID=1052685 RepID=A0A8E2ATL5_9APHY|nr:hypothetical protein OBBRIDRAFT_889448 [Obba rivulosa]
MDPRRQAVNVDVLIHIAGFLHGADLLHLMCTCRAAYFEGTKIQLRAPVTLHHKNIQAFCAYILSDGCWRAPFLRRLSERFVRLHIGPDADRIAEMLAKVFRHACNIQDIRFLHTETLLSASPELPRAISRLAKVKAISLSRAGPLALGMLTQMSCPFIHVHLSPVHGGWEAPCSLFPQREHLRTLRLNWARLSPSQAPVSYPSLRSLNMEFARVQDLELLPRLFPNLRHLNLERLGGPVVDDNQAEEARRHHISQSAISYPWYRVTHVSGDVKTLYMLAFSHEIRRLDVHRMELSSSHIAERLAAVLLETRPTHLELEIVLPGAKLGRTSLARLVPAESRLTHLRLTFPSNQSLLLDMDNFIEALLTLINQTPLKYLQLDVRPPSRQTDGGTCSPYTLVNRLIDACPSLRFISIHLRDRKAHFAVTGGGPKDGGYPLEIDDAVSSRVMGREWM